MDNSDSKSYNTSCNVRVSISINVNPNQFANTLYSTRTRGQSYKLYSHKSFIDVRKQFFCECIVITCNNLPATSDNFSSFSSFKCSINSVDLTSHVSLGF